VLQQRFVRERFETVWRELGLVAPVDLFEAIHDHYAER
jgi:hypothetical protein